MRDVVVIGGSAGALQAVTDLIRALPSGLPASIALVIHTSPDTPGTLPTLLGKHGLRVDYAKDGDALEHGRVYIARPDHHLLVQDDGRLRVAHGPRENGFRPAIDPLFRTAAEVYGARVVGIVLSGGLGDGTTGLALVKRHGGIAIAQHPDDALVGSMPLNAIRNVAVDHVVRAAVMATLIVGYANEAGSAYEGKGSGVGNGHEREPDPAARGTDRLHDKTYDGPPSVFTCPECGGSLWERTNGEPLRYTCHVGHAYGPEALVETKLAGLEPVLWTALRALEENSALLRRLADRASGEKLTTIATSYVRKAEDIERNAALLRNVLVAPSVPMPLHARAEGSGARAESGAGAGENGDTWRASPRGRSRRARRDPA